MTNIDPRSLKLARDLLVDEQPLNTEKNAEQLALAIQNAIEDWFLEAKTNYVEPPTRL